MGTTWSSHFIVPSLNLTSMLSSLRRSLPMIISYLMPSLFSSRSKAWFMFVFMYFPNNVQFRLTFTANFDPGSGPAFIFPHLILIMLHNLLHININNLKTQVLCNTDSWKLASSPLWDTWPQDNFKNY